LNVDASSDDNNMMLDDDDDARDLKSIFRIHISECFFFQSGYFYVFELEIWGSLEMRRVIQDLIIPSSA
jgi:hypothetical protein